MPADWYLELMSPMGHWSPQLWADQPSVQTIHGTDYLRSAGGHSPRVRAVQEVPEHLAGAGLKAVQAALSPDRVEVEVAAAKAKPVDLSPEALDAQVAALNAEAKGWGDFCSGKSLLEAALTIATLAAEREALGAGAYEAAAARCDQLADFERGKREAVSMGAKLCAEALRRETTPDAARDALDAMGRAARAEGMRAAADLFRGSDLWEEAGVRQWILAAAEKEARHG